MTSRIAGAVILLCLVVAQTPYHGSFTRNLIRGRSFFGLLKLTNEDGTPHHFGLAELLPEDGSAGFRINDAESVSALAVSVPVLWVPGSRGAWKEVFPIAAEASRVLGGATDEPGGSANEPEGSFADEPMAAVTPPASQGPRLRVFALDFNSWPSALHGTFLEHQASTVNLAIQSVVASIASRTKRNVKLVVLAHSMGAAAVLHAMSIRPELFRSSVSSVVFLNGALGEHALLPSLSHAFARGSVCRAPEIPPTLAIVSVTSGHTDDIVPSKDTALPKCFTEKTKGRIKYWHVSLPSTPNVFSGFSHINILHSKPAVAFVVQLLGTLAAHAYGSVGLDQAAARINKLCRAPSDFALLLAPSLPASTAPEARSISQGPGGTPGTLQGYDSRKPSPTSPNSTKLHPAWASSEDSATMLPWRRCILERDGPGNAFDLALLAGRRAAKETPGVLVPKGGFTFPFSPDVTSVEIMGGGRSSSVGNFGSVKVAMASSVEMVLVAMANSSVLFQTEKLREGRGPPGRLVDRLDKLDDFDATMTSPCWGTRVYVDAWLNSTRRHRMQLVPRANWRYPAPLCIWALRSEGPSPQEQQMTFVGSELSRSESVVPGEAPGNARVFISVEMGDEAWEGALVGQLVVTKGNATTGTYPDGENGSRFRSSIFRGGLFRREMEALARFGRWSRTIARPRRIYPRVVSPSSESCIEPLALLDVELGGALDYDILAVPTPSKNFPRPAPNSLPGTDSLVKSLADSAPFLIASLEDSLLQVKRIDSLGAAADGVLSQFLLPWFTDSTARATVFAPRHCGASRRGPPSGHAAFVAIPACKIECALRRPDNAPSSERALSNERAPSSESAPSSCCTSSWEVYIRANVSSTVLSLCREFTWLLLVAAVLTVQASLIGAATGVALRDVHFICLAALVTLCAAASVCVPCAAAFASCGVLLARRLIAVCPGARADTCSGWPVAARVHSALRRLWKRLEAASPQHFRAGKAAPSSCQRMFPNALCLGAAALLVQPHIAAGLLACVAAAAVAATPATSPRAAEFVAASFLCVVPFRAGEIAASLWVLFGGHLHLASDSVLARDGQALADMYLASSARLPRLLDSVVGQLWESLVYRRAINLRQLAHSMLHVCASAGSVGAVAWITSLSSAATSFATATRESEFVAAGSQQALELVGVVSPAARHAVEEVRLLSELPSRKNASAVNRLRVCKLLMMLSMFASCSVLFGPNRVWLLGVALQTTLALTSVVKLFDRSQDGSDAKE